MARSTKRTTRRPPEPLAPSLLYTHCDPALLDFASTDQLADLPDIAGQAGAAEAIRFGAGIRHGGYNIFVLGNTGSGRYVLARRELEAQAQTMPAAADWCYVHNFTQPREPLALSLPAGRGAEFAAQMRELARALPGLLDTGDESFEPLVARRVDKIRAQYADQPQILDFLAAVQADLLGNIERLREPAAAATLDGVTELPPFLRCQANLLTSHAGADCAPVVFENLPTCRKLLGRIDRPLHQGSLLSHFGLIQAGALHRANGGFLILDANELLEQPDAWEALKRALLAREIDIEAGEDELGSSGATAMRPRPIPLDVKVVLFGERELYYLLYENDPDFAGLFKVVADFEDEVERSPENTRLYARMIATLLRRQGLRPFDSGAVARTIEHCARLAESSTRLLAHARTLDDLLVETDHFAAAAQRATACQADVDGAIAAQIHRAERLRRLHYNDILDGTVLIATDGMHVGQVNGLGIVDLDNFIYAHPVRITATARLGEGNVIDIEREVELGGAIHSKGVLILTSFLAARYSHNTPLSLNASLVFEQSYSAVEGDSASLAELCALLSALSGLPINQGLAVTGSVNQYGQVQAIGGVNEKVEGYFDICNARGLDGRQGVLIPAANVRHLMLRRDVVEAARAGRFHVYAVADVDQAMELLTGVQAGKPDARGAVPEDSVNYLVAAQLVQLSLMRKDYAEVPLAPRPRRKPGASSR